MIRASLSTVYFNREITDNTLFILNYKEHANKATVSNKNIINII